MVGKVFRIMSDSPDCLSADTIAMALLQQVTLNSTEPNAVFAVEELPQVTEELKACACIEEEAK